MRRPATAIRSVRFAWWRAFLGLAAACCCIVLWIKARSMDVRRAEEREFQRELAAADESRSAKRWSLPVAVFGSASTKAISRGYL